MAEIAPVVNYNDLNLKINDDGIYEYPFYHYTYFAKYIAPKSCNINKEIRKKLLKNINKNNKIEKILCVYINSHKKIMNPTTINLINDSLISKLNKNKTILDNAIVLENSSNSKMLAYLWNNGYNSLLEIVCNDDGFIDLSENTFITIKNKIGNQSKNEERFFEDVLTLKFDPKLPTPPKNNK